MQEPNSIDLANWMQQLSPLIGDWSLKKIVIPGTHDSGMYKGMLPADYAKNQNLDFRGQLNKGARYFDFRLGYFWKDCDCAPGAFFDPRNGGECWSCPPGFNRTWEPVTAEKACSKSWFGPFAEATFHRSAKLGWQDETGTAVVCFGNFPSDADYYMYGHGGPSYIVDVKVSDVLRDIKGWLIEHPGEVILLNVAATPKKDSSRLEELFSNCLSPEFIYDAHSPILPQNATLNQLKGKVILLTDNPSDVGVNKFWEKGKVWASTGWGNKEDPAKMLEFIDKGFDQLRPSGTSATSDAKMLEIGATLTPNGEGVVVIPTNPQDLAIKFNPVVEDAVKNRWKGRALNIVSVDYIDISGVAEAIVRANWAVP